MAPTFSRHRGWWGVLATVLALAGQIALGVFVPQPGAVRDELALRAVLIQCAPGGPADRSRGNRHDLGGLSCALATAAALPLPLPTPPPVVPAPRGLVPMRLGRPDPVVLAARPLTGAALPRGPPVLG